MNAIRTGLRSMVGVGSVLVLILILPVAHVVAAPDLELELKRDEPVVTRADQRIQYTVQVKNAAAQAPATGDQLICNGAPSPLGTKEWFRQATTGYSFEFQWLRNGVPSTVWTAGAAGTTYTVAAADEGKTIQCLVKGTNGTGSGSFLVASQPRLVAEPQPSVQPPVPNSPTAANRRPAIAGPLVTGTETTAGAEWKPGEELRCTAPTAGWSTSEAASPITWTFAWLRDGAPAAGVVTNPTATTSRYALTTEDVAAPAAPAVFQCIATATNAGGAVVVESAEKNTKAPAPPFVENTTDGAPFQAPAQVPVIEFENAAVGPMTVELKLPAGALTSVYGFFRPGGEDYDGDSPPEGWNCSAQVATGSGPAKAICTRPQNLAPQSSFPGIKVAVALGADAPDHTVVEAVANSANSASPVAVDEFEFAPRPGFEIFDFATKVADATGTDYTRAGGHAYSASAGFSFTRYRNLRVPAPPAKYFPIELAKNLHTEIPPGFIGNPEAVPQLCPSSAEPLTNPTSCPAASIVGGVTLVTSGQLLPDVPVYAIEPERGTPAQFVFVNFFNKGVYTLTPRLRANDGYAITIEAAPVTQTAPLLDVEATLCGFGANTGSSAAGTTFTSCKKPDEPGANPKPFLTNQTECSPVAPVTRIRADSWTKPDDFQSAEVAAPLLTHCDEVPFSPTIEFQPTSHRADSPTGLDVSISVPTLGLEDPVGLSQAHLKRAIVTLPKGMAVNPAAGNGLGACGTAEIRLGTNDPVTCPDSAKIGTAEIETPLLSVPLKGSVYLAKQGDNPFKSLLALYLVVESKERGILVKIPGAVMPGPDGQLVATFDDNPRVPFSKLDLHFNSGDRAALVNPPRCGTYAITSQLTPWSAADPDNPTVTETRTTITTFDVTSGPGGRPCPGGHLKPMMRSGLTNPVAGSSSPFQLSLSREDGSQRFKSLDLTVPKGLTAYLKGVPYCPDVVLAGIPSAEGTGGEEVARPSCPAASQIGTVVVGAGAGSNPLYVSTGRAYLAGPYKGAPLSIAIVTPAVAGPFDLGNVVVRSAVLVDPATAQISIKSDPIPTILHGIPLDVRDIRVSVDRPGFMLAPTNCQETRVDAFVTGEEGGSAPLSNRFQVGECGSLGFGPKLKLEYKGQTKRTGNPALRAVLTQPAGQANIANTQVILPKGSFIDNAHINNPCTRAEYAANACPAKSILGRATAWSPLLDEPLSGNVYFRSNGGERELPDIVAKLQGQVEVELVGYIDSIVNKKTGSSRVRNTFAIVPDAPVSRFVLQMKGGKLGLIENSKNLCKQKNRATVKMGAHNGLALTTEPVVKTSCGKKKNAKKRKK